jgi:hypothetical protein
MGLYFQQTHDLSRGGISDPVGAVLMVRINDVACQLKKNRYSVNAH